MKEKRVIDRNIVKLNTVAFSNRWRFVHFFFNTPLRTFLYTFGRQHAQNRSWNRNEFFQIFQYRFFDFHGFYIWFSTQYSVLRERISHWSRNRSVSCMLYDIRMKMLVFHFIFCKQEDIMKVYFGLNCFIMMMMIVGDMVRIFDTSFYYYYVF